MISNRSLSVCALLCLLLTGCKVNVSVLGEGTVQVLTPDLTRCAATAPDLCLNAGYNRAVELQATSADGYLFAGWAGDCKGTATCSLHSMGNRHVVAVFRKIDEPGVAFIPSMRYISDFFFSGPWPSDVRRNAGGTLDVRDYPVGNGRFPSSVQDHAAKQTGFARNGSLYIPLENQLLADTNTDEIIGHAEGNDDVIQLVNLDPQSSQYLHRTPLRIRLFTSDRLDSNGLLQLEPMLGHTLQAGTTYALVLFSGSAGTSSSLNFAKSAVMQTIINQGAPGLLGQHWNRVQSFVSEHTSFAPADVAAFSVFTTQSVNPDYLALMQFLAEQNLETSSNIRFLGDYNAPGCPKNDPASPRSQFRNYRLALPNILSGKPPYLLGGGRLNLNSAGRIEATDTPVNTEVVVAVPCAMPAAGEKRPIEIHSLPTGHEIHKYWWEYLPVESAAAEANKAIRVFIAAPHTWEREYTSGYQSLGLLTDLLGIGTLDLAVALGDFNPFNIGANEPQYLQYAMEILYTKAMLRQMNVWGIRELQQLDESGANTASAIFADISQAQPDFDDITLVGTSLGGISALHANAIDPTHKNLIINHMPRPYAGLINDVWDYLDEWLGAGGKKALASFLGVKFPVAQNDPLLGLLQTVIDRVDTNSLIEHTHNQNILLTLSPHYLSLHGREASYSVASAFDQQFGLTPLWREGWSEYSFPFQNYVQSPLHFVNNPVQTQPVRVLLPARYAQESVLSFSTQMRAGNGFIWEE